MRRAGPRRCLTGKHSTRATAPSFLILQLSTDVFRWYYSLPALMMACGINTGGRGSLSYYIQASMLIIYHCSKNLISKQSTIQEAFNQCSLMVKLGLKLFSNSQMLASREIRKKPPRAQVRSSLGYNSSFTVKQKPNKSTNHHHNNPRSMASLAFLLPTRNMNEREVSEQPFFPVGNLDRLCPAGL